MTAIGSRQLLRPYRVERLSAVPFCALAAVAVAFTAADAAVAIAFTY